MTAPAAAASLRIRLHPDPVLREPCAPVTGDATALARAMLDAMYAAPGRGLAGPQVGESLRLFVMDASWKEGLPDPRVFVNPAVVWVSDETDVAEEGCLSIPDTPRRVRRPVACRIAFDGAGGLRREAVLDGFAARCAQHEIDHLDGVLILDHEAQP
ncbi:peptide deformylase [Jannaschia sp. W003]|uniref:peptide deformylase n=1 Tax=Jannaschia sp. W003 TaxID=2867012 RepID=UPI0021A568CE|nr:peptide deformylase [Jannaschia sp. W003]UWQ22878.1 peptide deformylase [Jannaschia sp. W003]